MISLHPRAYQELLYNLVDMEGSASPDIKEAGRVLRSSVFYEPEYRELCLQQLSSYNPDRMSRDYLTDLVSTTHVFLKLMEHMSKNKHLIVSKKTKKTIQTLHGRALVKLRKRKPKFYSEPGFIEK